VNGTQGAQGGSPAAARIDIRPARDADRDAIRDFLVGLSLRTRYLRFFAGVVPATPAMLGRMTGSAAPAGAPAAGGGDHIDALLATEGDVIIGHAMATDTREPSGARVTEIGVVVADARQGRGLGSALTRTLASRAQARGATTILMDVLAENRQMLNMIANHFPAASHHRSGPYVTIHVPLPRSPEEQPRESLSRARKPEPPGHGRQRRSPRRTAADLSVGGSGGFGRGRP
jgi:ribosomal protein S18 acetylase RimI-like enzyme